MPSQLHSLAQSEEWGLRERARRTTNWIYIFLVFGLPFKDENSQDTLRQVKNFGSWNTNRWVSCPKPPAGNAQKHQWEHIYTLEFIPQSLATNGQRRALERQCGVQTRWQQAGVRTCFTQPTAGAGRVVQQGSGSAGHWAHTSNCECQDKVHGHRVEVKASTLHPRLPAESKSSSPGNGASEIYPVWCFPTEQQPSCHPTAKVLAYGPWSGNSN